MGISASMNDSLDNSVAGPAPNPQNAKPKSQSDQLTDNFMQMLVAQMKNQDPTNPMQNNELTSQLAQIATVEGMERLNKGVQGISGQILANQSLQAMQMVGHGVMIPGNHIYVFTPEDKTKIPVDPFDPTKPQELEKFDPTKTEKSSKLSLFTIKDGELEEEDEDADKNKPIRATPYGFFIQEAADKIVVTIRNKDKAIVRTEEVEHDFMSDVYTFTWDALDDDGKDAPDGKYTFEVVATNQDKEVKAKHLAYTMVNGVTQGPEGPLLDVGIGNSVTLNQIYKVF